MILYGCAINNDTILIPMLEKKMSTIVTRYGDTALQQILQFFIGNNNTEKDSFDVCLQKPEQNK